jgi:predicted RNase H-like nuclease (RuvC/YqgF family)
MGCCKTLGNDVVVGIDSLPMSSPHGDRQYAVTIMQGSRVIERANNVSFMDLIKLVKKYNPSIIALDNIFELAESIGDLRRIALTLPLNVKIVQVTGSPDHGFKTLESLALDNGLTSKPKISPLESSEIIARLASMNIGYVVEVFDPKTIITISPSKITRKGGMSSERYRRGIESRILMLCRDVESKLKLLGLDYDLYIRRSYGGISNAKFVVFCRREDLQGIVHGRRGYVNIKIKPVPSRTLMFKPIGEVSSMSTQSRRNEYLIVGVDPGMVTGIALLNVNGEVLLLTSKRGIDRSEIIKTILSYGTPVAVSSDVNPPSRLVEKLASTLNLTLYSPPRSLQVSEKISLVQNFVDERKVNPPQDPHQRDALAAAIKAFQSFKNKMEQAEAHAQSLGLKVPNSDLRALIIKGYSISEALNMLNKPISIPETPPATKQSIQKPNVENLVKKLNIQRAVINALVKKLRSSNNEVLSLRLKIKDLEDEIERIKSEEYVKIRRDREVEALRSRVEELSKCLIAQSSNIDKLRRDIEDAKKGIIALVKGEIVPVKILHTVQQSSIKEAQNTVGIKRFDVLYVQDPSSYSIEAIKELAKINVLGIISKNPPSHLVEVFEENGIPIMNYDEANVIWILENPFINVNTLNKIREMKDRLNEKIKSIRRAQLEKLISEYRGRRP